MPPLHAVSRHASAIPAPAILPQNRRFKVTLPFYFFPSPQYTICPEMSMQNRFSCAQPLFCAKSGGGHEPKLSPPPLFRYIYLFRKRSYAARSSLEVSSGQVGLQCAQAPVSLDALYLILVALRIGG